MTVSKVGKNTFSLSLMKLAGSSVGKVYGIDLFGETLESAKLLRARWRPAAVHTKFTSSKVSDTKLWVMCSKSTTLYSSYSPLTTPFGCYGATFVNARASQSMNFSMWSKLNVPIEHMSHLLAVGSPQAEFGGFGHEGSGVKLRGGWKPLATRPKVLIQALRVSYGEKYATYYAYFLDSETENWQLFCVGRKWGNKRKALWPSAFVEIPGPPARQRSGDLKRQFFRKGWVMDDRQRWHALDQMESGSFFKFNKGWSVSPDGWFNMQMGGMEHYDYPVKGKVILKKGHALPSFLTPDKVKQLYKMPAIFGRVSAKNSQIVFEMKDSGPNARAIIYYGNKDCLTFAPVSEGYLLEV